MDLSDILDQLRQERDNIDAAISALEGITRPNGTRRSTSYGSNLGGRKRTLSAQARKRISDAAKARWARARKAGRNTL